MKNKIFIYSKTGNKYVVLGEAEFKHPENRNWIKSIMYSPVDNPNKVYVREKTEFLDRFKEEE